MITKKTWDEFRATGLFLFINSILHAFGWAIVIEIDDETKEIKSAFPARVKFRGFDGESVSESHRRIADYIHKESDSLYKEAHDIE